MIVRALGGVMSNSGNFAPLSPATLQGLLYEVAMTPFSYLVVNFVKRREGVDVPGLNTASISPRCSSRDMQRGCTSALALFGAVKGR